MMKKTLAIITIMIILLLSSFAVISNANTGDNSFKVVLTPANSTVLSGNTVEIYIATSELNIGSNGMNVFSGRLNYDKTIFEEITSSNITGLNGWEISYNTSTGKLLLDNSNSIKTASQLCKITFTVKSSVTQGSGVISLENPETSNGVNDITGAARSATVNVIKVSSSKYTITTDKKITGITAGTTVTELKNNITGASNATVKDKNGNVITSSDKVGTGSTIEITGAGTYTLVVVADISGDGKVSVTDLSRLKLHLVEISSLSGIAVDAADINGDGKISLTDLSILKQRIVSGEEV